MSEIPLTQQWATAISGLGVKPVYMALSLWLIVFLGRSKERDMVLLRWSMIAFLAGEALCALNYLAAAGESLYLDLGHGLGMSLSTMFFAWGLFTLVDERIMGLTAPNKPCILHRFCATCWKTEEAPCLAHRVLKFTLPVLAIVSLLPFSVALKPKYMVAQVLGAPVAFSYPEALQFVDFRLYPLIALAGFTVAFLLLLRGGGSLEKTRLPLFAGVGFLAFALFRLFLLEVFRETPPWSDFWEEMFEFLSILGLGLFLFYYRQRLGLSAPKGKAQ